MSLGLLIAGFVCCAVAAVIGNARVGWAGLALWMLAALVR